MSSGGMLRTSATKYYGCCDHCARKIKEKRHSPRRAERHQARAREKRAWRKDQDA